ncbi:hypothetical protein HG536_0C02090 [Torulaspora globosa]|uniref:Probable metalloprotease ARX1 n=1 Tax=Torulaspora globosa TaxID=48254 RepID=A0A7G3ZEV4_9SACH|nr:uncharacterized protein HG536_0C02090 [Torulaspora globosa]QLL32040.1 hypothetical protein HG536_0C02090 [Torulaspora globosa]
MDLAVSREDSEILLKDRNVLEESVVDKYRTAGQICQTALKYVAGVINDSYHYGTAGRAVTVAELCLLGDAFLLGRLEQCYRNKVNERGIAVPTTIDVDQVASGWCPEVDDADNVASWNRNAPEAFRSSVTGVLRPGDLVKISVGVHIDGYTAQLSHTMVVYPVQEARPAGPLLGGKADAVAAAHIAMESVVALLACALAPEKLPRSLAADGSRNVSGALIRRVVDTVAQSYNCCVVPGSRVRRVRRFLAGQNEGIVAERDYKGVVWTESHQEAQLLAQVEQDAVEELTVAKRTAQQTASSTAIPTDDFIVREGEVYLIDLKMSPLADRSKRGLVTLELVDSYTGKSHRSDRLVARPGAFVRDFAQSHILKLKTSRQLLTKIDKQGVYPFKLSHLSSHLPLSAVEEAELNGLKQDLKSYRLGMSEISNNYLCVELPIQVAKWVPWDHILNSTNSNGNLSYDATAMALPGHELPLPKLGISALKLKSLVNSTNESAALPVARECSTVMLCGTDVSSSDKPELLRLTGGSKTCAPSWVHSSHELNGENPVVQGILQLSSLTKDKRFGLQLKETQPMKYLKEMDAMEL